MAVPTERFGKLLKKNGRVPHSVRSGLRTRLDEPRRWRNPRCHRAWFGFSGDGSGVLSHYYGEGKGIVPFPPMVTMRTLADLRAKVVDAAIRVAETSCLNGFRSHVEAISSMIPATFRETGSRTKSSSNLPPPRRPAFMMPGNTTPQPLSPCVKACRWSDYSLNLCFLYTTIGGHSVNSRLSNQ